MDFIANITQEWQWIKVHFNEYKQTMNVLLACNWIMIDYSISYPTKKIWTNLKLYFESYDFYNL